MLARLALAWRFQPDLLVWGGGSLLLAALLGQAFQKMSLRWRKARAEKKAAALDWTIIDQSMSRERPKRDCERQETLGICTGRECLVYDTCNFNIKKPLP